jgi:hypothetical protein
MIDSEYGERMKVEEATSGPCASANKEIPRLDLPYYFGNAVFAVPLAALAFFR